MKDERYQFKLEIEDQLTHERLNIEYGTDTLWIIENHLKEISNNLCSGRIKYE